MSPSLPSILQWLLHYKYLVLFPAVAVEGPIVTVIAGFLCSLRYLDPFSVYAVVLTADLCGDSVYYAMGRSGSHIVKRWARLLGATKERIAGLQSYFARHTGKTLIIAKLSHVIGAPVLFAAGVAQVPYWEFLGFNFMGTLPKSLLLLLIGFYFGKSYTRISRYLDYTGIGMTALSALLIVVFILMRKASKRYFTGE